jgi:UDP-N-acetylglucosamine 4-epimerase
MKKPQALLDGHRSTWLVTGAGGFIGSNLVEALLRGGQVVRGIDNFSTGRRENLVDVRAAVGEEAWRNLTFVEGDIGNVDLCRSLCEGTDFVLHQAAVVSVPRSFREPILSLQTNILGFLNVLIASRDAGVTRLVFASSSSVYGSSEQLPKVENTIGDPLSPYALAKQANELLAKMLTGQDGLSFVGLRYFNVFGPRQNPAGDYAAVIPKFVHLLSEGKPPKIFGDGETSRDFCFIDNVVQANLRAGLTDSKNARNRVFNIAYGKQTTLNEMFRLIRAAVARRTGNSGLERIEPEYGPYREGDIRHSLADISLAKEVLGYSPDVDVEQGLEILIGRMINGTN